MIGGTQSVYTISLKPHSHPSGFIGVTNAYGPSPEPTSCRPPTYSLTTVQEVTRPKTRFKPTLLKKSEVDGEANRYQHILVSYFNCTPHGDLVLAIITLNHCIQLTQSKSCKVGKVNATKMYP